MLKTLQRLPRPAPPCSGCLRFAASLEHLSFRLYRLSFPSRTLHMLFPLPPFPSPANSSSTFKAYEKPPLMVIVTGCGGLCCALVVAGLPSCLCRCHVANHSSPLPDYGPFSGQRLEAHNRPGLADMVLTIRSLCDKLTSAGCPQLCSRS